MSYISVVASVDPTRPGFASSTSGRRPLGTAPSSSDRLTFASRRVWDRLSEQERREHLGSMDPDAVRSLAASMAVIEQAKGILITCFGCDGAGAFAVLAQVSLSQNVKVRHLAAAVVEAASRQHDGAHGPSTSTLERVRHLLDPANVGHRWQNPDDSLEPGEGRCVEQRVRGYLS